MKELLLTPVKFSTRLSNAFLAAYYAWVLFDYHNYKEVIIKGSIKNFYDDMKEGMPQMYEALVMDTNLFNEALNKFEQQRRLHVNESLTIIFNQSFVMMITVFDVYLNDSLKTVLRKQPKLLKTLADDEKDITVSQVLDSESYEEIFDKIANKVLRRFDFKSIEQKISLLKKIGVDTESALSFKYHKKEIQTKFPDGYKLLVDYYSQRHEIVHQDKHYLKTKDDLEQIADFFSPLILSFGIAIGAHFSIKTDWDFISQGDFKRFTDTRS
jgi:hypothetical protein